MIHFDEFARRCVANGIKNYETVERQRVVTHLRKFFGQFTGEELYASLKTAGARISRSTVYRTLGMLVQVKMISQPDPGSIVYVILNDQLD